MPSATDPPLGSPAPDPTPARATPLAHAVPASPTSRDRGRLLPRRFILAVWLVAAATVGVLLLTVSVARPSGPIDTPVVGRPAPAFDLQALDGTRVALTDLRGSPVVVNFWASWCIPCREEAPLLAAADRRYGPSGLRVIGIVYQDGADNATAFMRQYGQTYPGLLDPGGRTAIDYGVFGIPETFFVDAAGVVRSHQIGAITGDDLRQRIESIMP